MVTVTNSHCVSSRNGGPQWCSTSDVVFHHCPLALTVPALHPPLLNMPSPDTNSATLWGPINRKRNKTELDEIAKALGIFRKKDRKDVMVKRINAHLSNHPELAKEKRFQGLFAYRRDMEVAGGAPKGSEEKEAEDELEASKLQKQASG